MSKKSEKITVTAFSGDQFEVDISDETCGRFGSRHGDRVKHPLAGEATVIGVAPSIPGDPDSANVLWCAFDCDGGRVCYGSNFKEVC